MGNFECGLCLYLRMKGDVILTRSRSRLDPGPVITQKLHELQSLWPGP